MEHKTLRTNLMTQYLGSQPAVACAELSVRTQVAALEATIAYCQTRRQQHEQKARTLEAICSELRLRKIRPN